MATKKWLQFCCEVEATEGARMVLLGKVRTADCRDCLSQGYHLAAGANVRFCKTCRRAKPSLTHHCHICKL